MTLLELAKKTEKSMIKKKLKLSVCESCTGGMLASTLTSISGSSQYFIGGIIAYSDMVKRALVGVKAKTLKSHGAVSVEVAKEMAAGIRRRLRSDIGLSITGIAGPSGGCKKKPVGLVFIGLATSRKVYIKRFLFKGQRHTIRRRSCREALQLLAQIVSHV